MPLVIGVDPGLASTGWGVIRERAGRLSCIDYGVIRTPSGISTGERLQRIHDGISACLHTHTPEAAGVESLYFTKNITSAIPVAQARGVILLALSQHGVITGEFTPQVIKQSVVGTGQADKEQVMQMIRVVLGMRTSPQPDHAADALAAAVAMLHSGQIPRRSA